MDRDLVRCAEDPTCDESVWWRMTIELLAFGFAADQDGEPSDGVGELPEGRSDESIGGM